MKHRSRFAMLSIVALLLFAAAAVESLAAPPSAPRNLNATLTQSIYDDYILFSWERGSMDDVIDHYVLYRARGMDATTGFELIYQLGGLDTLAQELASWQYSVGPGDYTYYLTAVNRDGESAPSNSVSVSVTPLPSVRFTTQPPTTTRVGAELVYDADATSSDGGTLRYELEYVNDSADAGASISIDPATGVVRLTPSEPGWITIYVRAILVSDARAFATQSFRIRVINCSEPNTGLSGVVVDDNGAPIENGMLIWDMLDGYGREVNSGSLQFTDGRYSIDTLDAGRYRLRVTYGAFATEWYADAYRPADATPVVVQCGSMTTASFTVTRQAPFALDVVSGTVKAKSSGLPVPAIIKFVGFEKGVPEHARGDRHMRIWAMTLDSIRTTGAFRVELPNTHVWTASATPWDPYGRQDYDTLVPQYYDRATHPGAATAIDGSLEIHFELERTSTARNTIGGTLRDNVGDLTAGYVVAYPITAAGQDDAGAVSVEVEGGRWSMNNLAPGDYVLFGYAYRSGVAPGYYRANDSVAITWRDATVVSVSDAMPAVQFDLYLRTAARGGVAKLDGMVGAPPGTARLREAGGLHKLMPVSGALVTALDVAGRIVGSAVTNRSGQFTIDRVPIGEHRLVIDKVGFFTESQDIVFEEGGSGATIEMERSDGPSAVPGELRAIRTLGVTPNPAADRLVIGFETSTEGSAELSLVDVDGRIVHRDRVEITSGANRVAIDLDGIAGGVYVVRIEGSGISATATISVVH